MTGPWMANFLEDFRGFMAKYWIVQPATDTEYWESMLADFNEIVKKYDGHRLVMNLMVTYTSFQEAIAAGYVKKEDAMPGVSVPDKAIAKALNDLARHQMIYKLLADIRMDLAICEVEGWSKTEFINQLKQLINSIGEDGA